MDFRDRHVVVTGGTGALGAAVLDALLRAGAWCHVPYRGEQSLECSPHRGHARVTFVALGDLADEAQVDRYYDRLASLWASIHVAGTYASAPIARSDKAALLEQLETDGLVELQPRLLNLFNLYDHLQGFQAQGRAT